MNSFLPSPFDFFLLLVLTAGMPIWALRSWRRLNVQLDRTDPDARVDAYRRVLIVQWSLVGFLAVHVVLRGIDPRALWIDLPLGTRTLGAFFVSASLVMVLIAQHRMALRDRETRAEARTQLGNLRPMLAHTPREWAWFRPVAWTAGICEEILYRGYLPWLVSQAMPLPWAFVVATLAFGAGHAYQGIGGVAKTTLVGAIMAGLTYASGSILPAVILHVAIDAINGHLAYRLVATEAEDETTAVEHDED